jgi:dethiobiotin synthetase
MTPGFFITGTDTGVGKTRVSCALLEACARLGYAGVGMKPVASGCKPTAEGLRSDDALALAAAGNVAAGYDAINPYAFAPATAPHLAAAAVGVEISTERVLSGFERLHARAQIVVVEGIGGWLTPIGPHATMADVAAQLGVPVILVVGVRLGCLNHALLTVAAVERSGLTLAGWVENRLVPDPRGELAGYSQALVERIGAPRLGALPFFAQEQPVAVWADFLEPAVLRRLLG